MNFLRLLHLIICILVIKSYGQDIIYKKDLACLKVNIVARDSTSISYKQIDPPITITHFISLKLVDSIEWDSGNIERFNSRDLIPERLKAYKNFLAVDIALLAFNVPNIEYEIIVHNNVLGLKVLFFYNPNQEAQYSHFIFPLDIKYAMEFGANYHYYTNNKVDLSSGFAIQSGEKQEFKINLLSNEYSYQTRNYIDLVLANRIRINILRPLQVHIVLDWILREEYVVDNEQVNSYPYLQIRIGGGLTFRF